MAKDRRLIDAKAGKKVFSAIAQIAEYKGVIHMVVPISEIDKLPTVDAVEVVRCKDCKCWDSETGFCDKHSRFYHGGLDWDMFNDDDFRSQGEGRTDG